MKLLSVNTCYDKEQFYRITLIPKKLIILIAFGIVFLPDIKAANTVSIFNEYTNSDTVDLGMCLPGFELQTIFILKNSGTSTLQMIRLKPSYEEAQIDEHPEEHREFSFVTPFPVIVPANSLQKFYFRFLATTGSFPPRKNTARLRLGLFDPQKINPPKVDSDLEGFRDFVVVARKTEHYIDVFENQLDFDSTYVFPPDTLRKELIIQNSSDKSLSVYDVKFQRSFNAEITVPIKPTPISISPYQTEGFQDKWYISYYPRNIGLDTAVLSFYYKPDPLNYPDSTDIRKTSIHAIGVQQDLGVIQADTADFSFDLVNFGDLDVGQSKEVKIILRTVGNLPFGALSQNIYNIDSDRLSDGFTLIRKMNDTKHLQPFTTDTVIIKFAPTRSDTVNARFVIESDIFMRDIHGYPDSVRYRTIYLRGVGRQAEIASIPDVIDFGNIIVNETGDCPTRRDSVITISNLGNLELRVQSMVKPDINTNPFKVQPGFITVPGRESRSIRIVFDSIPNKPGEYEAQLYLISNSPESKDTLVALLKARGIYPDTMDLRFPANIISKPGRRISLPVLIDKRKISVARIFTDTITYNKSILDFHGTVAAATASELAEFVVANQDINTGSLSLSIKTVGSERFLTRDTLIILEFDTYAGDAVSTPIHFVNPKFGDGICSRILSLNNMDGTVALDSVCGLIVKTGMQIPNAFRLKRISPNPANSDCYIEFDISESIGVEINLYSSFGEKLECIFSGTLPAGTYQKPIDLKKYSPGMYIIDMKSGIFRDFQRIIYTN